CYAQLSYEKIDLEDIFALADGIRTSELDWTNNERRRATDSCYDHRFEATACAIPSTALPLVSRASCRQVHLIHTAKPAMLRPERTARAHSRGDGGSGLALEA